MSRLSWRSRSLLFALAVFAAIVASTVGGVSNAQASTCTRNSWTKATLLIDELFPFPDMTGAETREAGWWSTSGVSSCWGQGLYHVNENKAVANSYCYVGNITVGYYFVNTDCTYTLNKAAWYTDSAGNPRYLSATFTNVGTYIWTDTDTPAEGAFTLKAAFTIRYDGTITHSCTRTGTVPGGSVLPIHCASGGILGGTG
jgi:hypothetical protein